MNPPPVLKASHRQNLADNRTFGTTKAKHSVTFSTPKSQHASVSPRTYCTAKTAQDTPSVFPMTELRPLNTATYFLSPLQTLLESLNDPNFDYITLHDVTEAYCAFSSRIRAQSHTLISIGNDAAALQPIKLHSVQIVECLKRDIQRMLVNPLQDSQSSLNDSLFSNSPPTDHEQQHARDVVMLSHRALCFLSELFTFSNLHLLFSATDLTILFDAIISSCLFESLPTPSSIKTQAIITWIMSVQQLNIDVLLSRRTEMILLLRRSISQEFTEISINVDGLKAISNLLRRHPGHFFASFRDLLPFVLQRLTSENHNARLQAAHALSGFALAYAGTRSDDSTRYLICKAVHKFIDKAERRKSLTRGALLNAIEAAASGKNPCWQGKGPSWSIVVIVCLAVLSDSALFSNPRSLRLIMSAIASMANPAKSAVPSSLRHLWKVLIWSFTRLSTQVNLPGNSCNNVMKLEELCEQAFCVVAQELRYGLGIDLVASLIGTAEPDGGLDDSLNLIRTANIARRLIIGENALERQNGFKLLHRLVSAIGAPSVTLNSHSAFDIRFSNLPSDLLDGTLLMKTADELKTSLYSTRRLQVDQVRQLTEQELLRHWDDFVDIWACLVERSIRDLSLELQDELFHMWQSFLLAHTQLTQEYCQLTTSSNVSIHVAAVVSRFVVQLDGSEQQLRQLRVIQRLWTVMKNVFSRAWLPTPAKIILAAVIKRNFLLIDDPVKATWSGLLADLISVGIPDLSQVLSLVNESKREPEITRQLWTVSVKHKISGSWQDMMTVLAIPFGTWVMTDAEFDIWEGGFNRAVAVADQILGGKEAVITFFLQHLGEEKLESLKRAHKAVRLVSSYVTLSGGQELNALALSVVDDVLVSLYALSTGKEMEQRSIGLDILDHLGRILSNTSQSQIFELLTLVQHGLSCWIRDEQSVLEEFQHDIMVQQMYCRALDIIAGMQLSAETLQKFAWFFISPFQRITHSSPGPIAFNKFWRTTYHGREQFREVCPDSIRVCLKAWSDVCGDSLGEVFSLDSSTQESIQCVVPDSQIADHSCYDHDDATIFVEDAFIVQSERTQEKARESNDTLETSRPPFRDAPITLPIASCSTERSISMQNTSMPNLGYSAPQTTNQNRSTEDSKSFSSGSIKRAAPLDDSRRRKRQRTASEPCMERGADGSNLQAFSNGRHDVTFHSGTQPSRSARIFMDCVEVPMFKEFQTYDKQNETKLRASSRSSIASRSSTPSSDEYRSWEANVLLEDDAELDKSSSQILENIKEDADFVTAPLNYNILETSVINSPHTEHRDQSRTEPYLTIKRPNPLRRNKTTSAMRIDALERAYAAIAEAEGVSQIPTQDLLQAQRLVNQINSALNQQMSHKLLGGKGDG